MLGKVIDRCIKNLDMNFKIIYEERTLDDCVDNNYQQEDNNK